MKTSRQALGLGLTFSAKPESETFSRDWLKGELVGLLNWSEGMAVVWWIAATSASSPVRWQS
jgi:hypothetical protein